MTEPNGPSDVPPIPEPFRKPAPVPIGGSGCGMPALIGCGLVAAALLVASALVVLKAEELFRWGLSHSREAILEALPEDLEADARVRLERAFEATADAVAEEHVGPAQLQHLQSELGLALRKAQARRLEVEDVARLTVALEEIGGISEDEGAGASKANPARDGR